MGSESGTWHSLASSRWGAKIRPGIATLHTWLSNLLNAVRNENGTTGWKLATTQGLPGIALKLSRWVIRQYPDDRMFFWHFLTSFGCVSSNFLILPRCCCHFPRHLSQLPALLGGSVGTQGHCQAAPKGSARCSGRLGWGHQTWPIQLQGILGMAAWRPDSISTVFA